MTLHLSQITLNPEHGQARRDLATPYELHRTLARAFPDTENEQHRARHGLLYRIEEPKPTGVPVLVQSTTEPDWSRLPSGYVSRLDGPKPFEPVLGEGQRLRFRLIANPVRRTNVEGKKHPRREALVHPTATDTVATGYLDWLVRKAADHGFRLPTATDAPEPLVEHVPFRLDRKRTVGAGKISKDRLPHFGVRFDGTLSVTDPEALSAAVQKGIGPAKAFGFGLLSLAPA